jgi:rod shape-determining protein MreC
MAKALETRRSHLLLVGLVVSHIMIISHQVDAGGGASLLQKTAFVVFSPLQRTIAAAIRLVRGGYHGYVDLRGVGRENAVLRDRANTLEVELERQRRLAEEAVRLRELLELQAVLPYPTVAAEVLSRDVTPWFRSVTIGKGSGDGVRLNAAVVSPSGVVGRVIGVGPRAARVQLLLDREAGVGALLEKSRASGVCAGQVGFADQGQTDLVMRYVPALAEVATGERVLTSGLDRIYPKGLVIGRVRSVGPPSGLFREVIVTPTARFDQLEQVLVMREPLASLEITESVR